MRPRKLILLTSSFLLPITLAMTVQSSIAKDGGPDQLLLTTSDLPTGTRLTVQGSILPNNPNNGFVNKDGRDLAKGYIDGARAEYSVPVSNGLELSAQANSPNVYLANYVFRFENKQAATVEFERLKKSASEYASLTDFQIKNGQAVTFQVGDLESPYLASRWMLMQRGKYVILFMMNGMFNKNAAEGPTLAANDGNTVSLTKEFVDGYSVATDDLFNTSVLKLAGK